MKIDYDRRHRIYHLFPLMILLILLIIPNHAMAEGPRETLEHSLNQVLEVLRNSRGEADRESRIKKISAISERIFDFREIAGRSLGVQWKKLDEDEKRRFVNLYQSLLKQTYADRILSYKGGKIVYKKTLSYGDDLAEVYTSVPTEKGSVPIDYRLKKEGSDWHVYDVVIEGVSLVSNYKSQFQEILADKSMAELFAIMERKVSK